MRRRAPQPSGRSRLVLVILGFVLLVGAWEGATVAFGAPDEPSHYERALSLTHGVILGPKVPYLPAPPQMTPTQGRFINHDTRSVIMPARLAPGDVSCIDGKPDVISCAMADPNGNFPPLGYVLPAVALRASHTATAGLWLTRTASALQSVAFLVLAIALLWDTDGWSIIGLLAAMTPMVLFSASIVNTSGIEIAACLAFAASMLRVTRAPDAVPGWVWGAFALSGAVGMLTGPIGIAFVIGDLIVMCVLVGPRRLRRLLGLRHAQIAGFVLLASAVVAEIYTRIAGYSEKIGFSPVGASLHGGLAQLGTVLRDAVGTFGALTIPLPAAARWVWWALVLLLLVTAATLAGRRAWAGLTILVVLSLAFPVLFWAWIDRYSGFGLQGREILPALQIIPLVAGELIYRRRSRLTSHGAARLAVNGLIALMGVSQLYAWWVSASSAAGARLHLGFYTHSIETPVGGWWPWILGAVLGTVALLGFATMATARPRTARTSRAPASAAQSPVSAGRM